MWRAPFSFIIKEKKGDADMFKKTNLNPSKMRKSDCVVRAIAQAMQTSWEKTYLDLVMEGYAEYNMPSANEVWDGYLRKHGFERHLIPNTCPMCYTVEQFCKDHPNGAFILATGSHVLAVEKGDYYDTWDSGDEVPIYYYVRR